MASNQDRIRESEAPRALETLRSGDGVPQGYAERAMNSLMSLHTDLMSEKERSLDLTRRLMEERQSRAEIESYVRLLEAEIARLGGPNLTGLHGRPDGVARAGARILDDLRGAPARRAPAEPPVDPARPGPPPEVATKGATSEPTPRAGGPDPDADVPTPPPPSPRYRTPQPVARDGDPAATGRDGDAPAGAAPARHASEGWRQW